MKKSVQVVLINEEGFVLSVSRKNNHNDFGLVGGSVENYDTDEVSAAIRETKEETGLDITNLRLIYVTHRGGVNGNMGYTYLADHSGEINYTEPHVVKWTNFSEIIKGSFGEWNENVSKSLDSMGIFYIK